MRRSDFSALPKQRLEIDGEVQEVTDYPAIAKAYAEAVVAKKLIVCRQVIKACKRYLKMLDPKFGKKHGFYYSPLHVIDYCQFMEKLRHFESGRWTVTQVGPDGKPDPRIIMEPWQIWIESAIQGFRKISTDERLVSTALELVPRKNAKSLKGCAAIFFDGACSGDLAPEIPIAAASERQSDDTIYGDLSKMIDADEDLVKEYDIEKTAKEIRFKKTGGRVFKLTAQGEKTDGLNPSLAFFEEGHAGAESVYRVVDSAFGARPGQLLRMITTAGYQAEGPAFQLMKQAELILDEKSEDWTFFAAIYTLDHEDYMDKRQTIKWDDLLNRDDLLAKANPMYGISLDPDSLRKKRNDAKLRPDLRGEFARTRFNIWTSAGVSLIQPEGWWACKRNISLEDFQGEKCWIGVDLATRLDLCAITLVFEMPNDVLAVFSKAFLPKESPTTTDPDLHPYFAEWEAAEEGWLVFTEGPLADHDRVREEIELYCDLFNVQTIACDPYQAHNTIKQLWDDHRPVMSYQNTDKTMTAPTDDIIARVINQSIWHDGNPVLAWFVANVHGERRGNGLILPRKESKNSKQKIDGFVAMCFANGVRIQPEQADEAIKDGAYRSPYARANAQLIGAD